MAKLKNKSESEAACWEGTYHVLVLLRRDSSGRTAHVVREAVSLLTVNHSAKNPARSISQMGLRRAKSLGLIVSDGKGIIRITEKGINAARLTKPRVISMLLAEHARYRLLHRHCR